jgi:hypothetical protein
METLWSKKNRITANNKLFGMIFFLKLHVFRGHNKVKSRVLNNKKMTLFTARRLYGSDVDMTFCRRGVPRPRRNPKILNFQLTTSNFVSQFNEPRGLVRSFPAVQ